MATGILPPCSRGKIPVAILRFLLRKKKRHRHSIRRGLVFFYGAFALVYFLIGNFFMVDSPRFPNSSGIDPKKALLTVVLVLEFESRRG